MTVVQAAAVPDAAGCCTVHAGVAANVGGKVYQSSTQFNRANAKPGASSNASGLVAVNGVTTAVGSAVDSPSGR